MPPRSERTYLEIDRNALRKNLNALRSRAEGKKTIAVVKANAYGHGEGSLCAFEKADGFAVATVDEGLRVRARFPDALVLVLGYVPFDRLADACSERLTLTVYDEKQALSLQTWAKKNRRAFSVHCKLDTGMRRLGFLYDDEDAFSLLRRCDRLRVDGAFSHLAVSQATDEIFYRTQLRRFDEGAAKIARLFPEATLFHLGGSAAIDAPIGNAVRVGYALYGYGRNLTPALTWKARVVRTYDLAAGETLGYDRAYTAKRDERVALLSVGYGDGYPRCLSCGNGRVLTDSGFLPVVGRICMDYAFVLADEKTREGDFVILLGSGRSDRLLPDDLGFGYEILCSISPRVPRFYV